MDQNEVQDEEQTDDQHYRSHYNCHKNFIRPSSSSSIRAPSWSLGFGADSSNDGELASHDCCCSRMIDQSPDGDASHCCRCHDESTATNGSQADDNKLPQCPALHVDIPTVYLTRRDSSNSSSFHVYQVNIRTSAEAEWSIYRRYSQFLALHQRLKSCNPAIGKLSFPPKRRLNSKASTIVQERRRKLEEYMQQLCKLVVESPVDSVAESGPYQLLTSLAMNGPTKLPRSASSAGVSDLCAPSRGSMADDDRSECTNSNLEDHERANGLSANCIELAIDVDEMSTTTNELGDEELIAHSPAVVVPEEAGHLEPVASQINSSNITKQNNKNKTKSFRYTFYEFISPRGTNEAEFELDHLGV